MPNIDAATISTVLDVYLPERARLIQLLADLDDEQWARSTECPAYSVHGIASHILGDDLSLLSRQRDGALPGLVLMAERVPGADFRALLDSFNDQWVEATRFFSPPLLLQLLDLAGQWTHGYYCDIDPAAPGEPVPMFGVSFGDSSPVWHAIAREYLERWAHHSQIRRALGFGSLADAPFLETGHAIIATVAGAPTGEGTSADDTDTWTIGPIVLGDRSQAADILTSGHSAAEVAALADGPSDLVSEFAARVGRR
ncbi:MAG: maleylpyruvate isomerase family mycothiol-dependent enzyme [Ilumatobacteraceae bacterium]